MNCDVALATTPQTISDSFIFNNAVSEHSRRPRRTVSWHCTENFLSCSVLSCRHPDEPCCNQQEDQNGALALTGVCSVPFRWHVFTGDKLQASLRLQISRFNVLQGLVRTRSRALTRGAISQTHCNQLVLQQLLLSN